SAAARCCEHRQARRRFSSAPPLSVPRVGASLLPDRGRSDGAAPAPGAFAKFHRSIPLDSLSRGLNHAYNRLVHTLELRQLDFQLLPSRLRELVIAGPAVASRHTPF